MPILLDNKERCEEFYNRMTAFQHLDDGQNRAGALFHLCMWIYKNCGREMMEAVLDREMKDETTADNKRIIVCSIIAIALREVNK
jgi:hypothetical protein